MQTPILNPVELVLQTSRFREDARNIIRSAVGATEEDAVIFVGSGSTGASR